MPKLQPVRGTHDLLPEDMHRHRHVIETFVAIAESYGFGAIETPVFEFSEVFARTLGETSDIVTKEMYSFEDRGGDSLTLRPENTAGIVRAFISGGLMQRLPLKLYTHGPMFRYERPQKGRMRQFHQIDAEILGVAGPQADIELIAMADHLLEALGVRDKAVLELGTLGDGESREAFRKALVDYFSAHEDTLSKDSVSRLKRNPLRILDSKDEGDKKLIRGAPEISDFLNSESRDFFDAVKQGLDDLGIEFTINSRLVRGLDYYTHTAFEFTTRHLGAQDALIAGGRYDGLVEQMGGPPTPGIGWAGGIERLALITDTVPPLRRPVALVPMGEEAQKQAMIIAQDLRRQGLTVDVGYSGNVSKRMKRADKINARAALILGEVELKKGVVTLRDMKSGDQREVRLERLADELAAET